MVDKEEPIKKPHRRRCLWCQAKIEWLEIKGRTIPIVPGTNTRHTCRQPDKPTDREGYI